MNVLRYLGFLGALVFVGVFATPTMTAGPQTHPIPDASQPTGTARISGRVLAADDGKPVRRVLIRLWRTPTGTEAQRTGTDPYVSRATETDGNGGFAFADLPAGFYWLQVESRNGFVRPLRAKGVTLTAGGKFDVTLRLERTGAMTGQILDPFGDPILGARVQALRRDPTTGDLQSSGGPSGATDDLGKFRLFGLREGDYYVVATYSPRRPIADPPAQPDTSQKQGYAATYYPGRLELHDARLVHVRAAKDTTNIDLALAPVHLARVLLSVIDSHGQPRSRDTQITLEPAGKWYLDAVPAARLQDGTFVIQDVSPGNYRLVVTSGARREEGAYLDVTVSGDMSLHVRTNTGAIVSGRVAIKERLSIGNPTEPERAWVSATQPSPCYGVACGTVPLATLRGTDTFELAGLRGPMVLRGEVVGGALVSVRRGDEEITGKTLNFVGTERIDDVVMTFTTDVARLTATITGMNVSDDEPAMVVLFTEDPDHWHEGFVRYGQVIGPDPKIEMGRMVPGRYLVIAVPDHGIRASDRRVLEKLKPLAVPVTLVGGETTSVSLKVVRIK